MTTALYAGSFDPFTIGHLHVIKQASALFDRVIVDMGANPDKTRHYKPELMKKAIEESMEELGITNVEVIIYDGATVTLALEEGVDILIRGVRNAGDLAEEEELAFRNYEASNIDTMYVRAGVTGNISSSMVRDFLQYGYPIDKYVTEPVKKLIMQKRDM